MACIVYQTDKRTGIKYAYESVSYWDKEKKQPRSKRTYIGKVDPETGEIIRSEAKKKKQSETAVTLPSALSPGLEDELQKKDEIIKALTMELEVARSNEAILRNTLDNTLARIRAICGDGDAVPCQT